MKTFWYIALGIAAIFMLAACGGSDSLGADVTVEGLGTQNVRIISYHDGAVHSSSVTALDGKFRFTGQASTPTLFEVYTGSRSLIGSFVAKNGDNLDLKFTINEPGTMQAKGNRITEDIARFRTDNAVALNSGDYAAVNKAIALYVRNNSDNPSSSFIVLTLFNPADDARLADSLLNVLSLPKGMSTDLLNSYRRTLIYAPDSTLQCPAVRAYTTGDSAVTLVPRDNRAMLVLLSGDSEISEHDSIARRLNEINDSIKAYADVVEMSTVADTAAWHKQARDTKPHYRYTWLPAGVSTPSLSTLYITQTPWAVATDTLGSIVYSGPSLEEAAAVINNY